MYDCNAIAAALKRVRSPLSLAAEALVGLLVQRLQEAQRTGAPLLAMWEGECALTYGDLDRGWVGNSRLDPEIFRQRWKLPPSPGFRPTLQLLAVQTCYSLMVRLLALRFAAQVQGAGKPFDCSLAQTAALLDGRLLRSLGVPGFREDWYCWFLSDWTPELETKIHNLVKTMEDCERPELLTPPGGSGGLKAVYERLIPKEVRHALGEFYTPEWLADRALDHAIEPLPAGVGGLRFLDPACGSGAFLLAALDRPAFQGGEVLGFDVSALAVLSARTNCLLSRPDQLRDGTLTLPIYHCDSVCFPEERDGSLRVDTGCGYCFSLPESLVQALLEVEKGGEFAFSTLLDTYGGRADPDTAFHALDPLSTKVLGNLVLDRVLAWAAPPADVVAGNPPWINWEYLPADYREKTRALWPRYGLFDAKGRGLSFSKEDFSVLFTYVTAERYLKDGGYLSFLLRQSLFKSARNGEGFRRFRLRQSDCGLRVVRADDLSALRPFDGVGSACAMVLLQKGPPTVYPVSYYLWRPLEKGKRGRRPIALVTPPPPRFREELYSAQPSRPDNPASPWVTAPPQALASLTPLLGENSYQARTGIFTGGANGVYWLRLLEKHPDGTVTAENLHDRARRPVASVQARLEPEFLSPLVQGADLHPWSVGSRSYLLCPHTLETKIRPVPGEILAQTAPLTWAYLSHFRPELEARRGFAGWEKEIQLAHFHAALRVGPYTFCRYKVAWRYIAKTFMTAVIAPVEDPFLGHTLPLPNEKLMYVGTDDEEEAYYLCGVLSASPVRACVESFMNPTSISAHVLGRLHLETFDPDHPLHVAISDLCRAGHGLTPAEQNPIRRRLDEVVRTLYHI